MKLKFNTMYFGKKDKRIAVTHWNKPIKMGLVGMVNSRMFDGKVALVIAEDHPSKTECDFAALAYFGTAKDAAIFLEREVFYDIIRGAPYARMTLLHEIGHHVNHDGDSHYGNMAEKDELRKAEVSKGSISEGEIAADDFAVAYLGAYTVYRGLKELLAKSCRRYDSELYDPGDTELSIREIGMRIQRVLEMVDDAELTDDEKIDKTAGIILRKYLPAFKALAG